MAAPVTELTTIFARTANYKAGLWDLMFVAHDARGYACEVRVTIPGSTAFDESSMLLHMHARRALVLLVLQGSPSHRPIPHTTYLTIERLLALDVPAAPCEGEP